MAKAIKSWAIRQVSKDPVTGEMRPFMETYFSTREQMREHYRNMMPIFKGINSYGYFDAIRFRVVDYPLIGKRSYTKVR